MKEGQDPMGGPFEANVALLQRFDPSLAARLRALPAPAGIRVETTPSGFPTLQALSEDGVEIRIHSAYQPLDEAKKFVADRWQAGMEAIILAGMGLGYQALEFSRLLPAGVWFFVVEAREDLFRTALEQVDLRALLSRPRTRFFVGADWMAYLGWFRSALEDSQVHRIHLVTHPPSLRLLPGFYRQVAAETEAAVNRRTIEVNTLVRHAEQMEGNAIRNIAFLPETHGVGELEGVFAGIPGMVVAAGPSLDLDADLLPEAASRAVTITVGKSLRLLANRGIAPEFVASLDMLEITNAVFEGYAIPEATTLLFDEDSHPEIPRKYPGGRVTYDSTSALMNWVSPLLGPFGYLEKGLSVAHTAFFLARHLGLDPIILVGVDLSLPGERTHAEGVTMTWGGKVDPANPHLVEVPSVDGGTVRSLKNFVSFVTAFEVEIARTRARVIHTSHGGALIRGAERKKLREVLSFLPRKPESVAQVLRERIHAPRTPDLGRFEQASRQMLGDLQSLREACESGLRVLGRARRLDRSNRLEREEFSQLSRKLDEYKDLVINGRSSVLLGRLVSRTALEIKELSLEKSQETDPSRRIEMELKWYGMIFEGYRAAVDFFRPEYERMQEELRARQGRKV